MDDERHLVRRAQRGDRVAFEILVEREQARLVTLATRLLGSYDDGVDAVQDALLRAWLALPRFRGDARFSTWLHRITLNAVHDHRTRRGALAEEPPEVADPHDPHARHALSGELQAALAALAEPYREAVVLHDVLGAPYEEVAELLGVEQGTVKSRIFRGRRELARLLGTSGALEQSD